MVKKDGMILEKQHRRAVTSPLSDVSVPNKGNRRGGRLGEKGGAIFGKIMQMLIIYWSDFSMSFGSRVTAIGSPSNGVSGIKSINFFFMPL